MNSLYTQLNSQKSNPLANFNPQQMINQMLAKNPRLNSVMSLLNSSSLSPKRFFYKYANEHGVDPDQFINSLKGM